MIIAAAGERFSVRAEGQGSPPLRSPIESLDGAAARDIPQPNRAVIPARCQCLAVWRERQRGHGFSVPFQNHDLAAIGTIPQPDCRKKVARSDPRSVGADRHRGDPALTARKRETFLARGKVPHLHRAVRTAGNQRRAVCADRQAEHQVRVAGQARCCDPLWGSHNRIAASPAPIKLRPSTVKAIACTYRCIFSRLLPRIATRSGGAAAGLPAPATESS